MRNTSILQKSRHPVTIYRLFYKKGKAPTSYLPVPGKRILTTCGDRDQPTIVWMHKTTRADFCGTWYPRTLVREHELLNLSTMLFRRCDLTKSQPVVLPTTSGYPGLE